jgi:hypothetical protein
MESFMEVRMVATAPSGAAESLECLTEATVDIHGLARDDVCLVEHFVELVRCWRRQRDEAPGLDFQLMSQSFALQQAESGSQKTVVTLVLESLLTRGNRQAPVSHPRRRRRTSMPL